MRTALLGLFLSVAIAFLTSPNQFAAENNSQLGSVTLAELTARRDQLVLTVGEGHPSVAVLDKRISAFLDHQRAIAAIEGHEKGPQATPNVIEMDDKDLRKTVQQLLVRVEQLEREIAGLKANEPKVELLKQ